MESHVDFERAMISQDFIFQCLMSCISKIENASEVVIWVIEMYNEKQFDPPSMIVYLKTLGNLNAK